MWSGIWKSQLNTRGLKVGVGGGFLPGSHSLIIGLLVSKQDRMIFSSYPTHLSLVWVNPPIPIQFWCMKQMIWGKRHKKSIVCGGSWSLICLQSSCHRIEIFLPSRITLKWKICRKNVTHWACSRSKASINDSMGGTGVVCRLHCLVNKNYQQELGCDSTGWWRNSWWKDCLSFCISSIFVKWVDLLWEIVAYERGWYDETEPSVLEHQMALFQLLPRFSTTDHGDCHFRKLEESLEKVTVLTSKRQLQACRTQQIL